MCIRDRYQRRVRETGVSHAPNEGCAQLKMGCLTSKEEGSMRSPTRQQIGEEFEHSTDLSAYTADEHSENVQDDSEYGDSPSEFSGDVPIIVAEPISGETTTRRSKNYKRVF
eukprot:TRINITY_DN3527_c0_g1_i2.p1 TRINITY_DN3527_c0_g1~~TRINITY_DN3527_c0_g1_i2.p1  ORF type:complete len:112 (-),score=16.18 TRINITY_DN3527_c0_g1_i2:448-783(-)